jgi:AraC-like DNA-binding protein
MPSPALPPLSDAVSRLWLPRPSLTSCMRAVMGRNTLNVVLTDEQRWNRFPATPLCSLNWWFAGSSELLMEGHPVHLDSPRHSLTPTMMFGGPFNRPSTSWNPGPAHGLMLMLQPDAMHLMTGIEPSAWLNRLVDVRDVLPAPWVAMCEAVASAPDDDARVTLLQDWLDPVWQAARPRLALDAHRYNDWAQGLIQRAATSATGRSLRQVERRIKQWTGQPMRELRGIGRAEKLFFDALASAKDDSLNWVDVATENGYADQSHLCRATRRITGVSPEELRRRIAGDEAFWAYRLWQ